MNVLVCVKRVPMTGGRIVLTDDALAIETRHLGFTISPHEECGVEEAVRIVEAQGGEVVVLTLGPAEAEEQLRDCMAIGADRGILLQVDGEEWDGQATAAAIVDAVRADGDGDREALVHVLDRERVGALDRLRRRQVGHEQVLAERWAGTGARHVRAAALRVGERRTVTERYGLTPERVPLDTCG